MAQTLNSDVTFTLGDALRRTRANANLNMGQIADRLGVSASIVSRWENDHVRPKRGMLTAWGLSFGGFRNLHFGSLDTDTQDLAPCRPMDEPNLLTTADVARITGRHRNTITRWRELGILPSVQVVPRGEHLYRREDVDRILTPKPAS